MKYADITDKTGKKRVIQRNMRTAHLYSSIFLDVVAILKELLPSDKALIVGQHLKSIMYALIELKMGKRPDKF